MLPSTMNGVLPFIVFTLTTPLLRSPYSTDGMPVTISTLSTFDTPTVRVLAAMVSVGEALLSMRMPSTSMAVPNEALPRSPLPLRSANRSSFMSEGLMVLPPGNRVEMSPMLMICWFSRAVLSMV